MSGSQRWQETVKRIAAGVVNTRGQPRWAYVSNVDPVNNLVRVITEPEGVSSGWLPVLLPTAALGNTDYAVPVVGAMACIISDMGEAEHGIVVGFAHNNLAPPPVVPNMNGTGGTPNTTTAPAASGELIISVFGSVIRLCANGDTYLKPGSGNVFIDGTLKVNGDVFDRHGSLDRLRGHYNTHNHTQPSDGHGDAEAPTNAPLPQDPE